MTPVSGYRAVAVRLLAALLALVLIVGVILILTVLIKSRGAEPGAREYQMIVPLIVLWWLLIPATLLFILTNLLPGMFPRRERLVLHYWSMACLIPGVILFALG